MERRRNQIGRREYEIGTNEHRRNARHGSEMENESSFEFLWRGMLPATQRILQPLYTAIMTLSQCLLYIITTDRLI